jgi:hypothetical protein
MCSSIEPERGGLDAIAMQSSPGEFAAAAMGSGGQVVGRLLTLSLGSREFRTTAVTVAKPFRIGRFAARNGHA